MRIHPHSHETRKALPNRSCLRRDRSDALIKPEGPGNSGHDTQHCWLYLARVTASGAAGLRRDPRCIFATE